MHATTPEGALEWYRRNPCSSPSISRASTKALAHVASVVERRNTIPILSNVHLATRNNELKLTSTDLDMEIVETVPARAKGEGATTVPAHMFHDIVRKLPEGSDIEIARDGDQGRLTISLRARRASRCRRCPPTTSPL